MIVKDKKSVFQKRHIGVAMGLIIGGLLVAVGIFSAVNYIFLQHEGTSVPETEVVTDDSATPSEKQPDMTKEYSVPAHQPRLIKIPSIGVEAYIQKVGINKAGEMATPTNIYFTGWYVNGVAPGEAGLSIINGHVGGQYSSGIFKNLKNTKTGETIEIQMGDLTWRRFEIVSVKSYSVGDSAAALYNDDPEIKNELHLITCEGNYNKSSDTYDKRLIVVAQSVGTN